MYEKQSDREPTKNVPYLHSIKSFARSIKSTFILELKSQSETRLRFLFLVIRAIESDIHDQRSHQPSTASRARPEVPPGDIASCNFAGFHRCRPSLSFLLHATPLLTRFLRFTRTDTRTKEYFYTSDTTSWTRSPFRRHASPTPIGQHGYATSRSTRVRGLPLDPTRDNSGVLSSSEIGFPHAGGTVNRDRGGRAIGSRGALPASEPAISRPSAALLKLIRHICNFSKHCLIVHKERRF